MSEQKTKKPANKRGLARLAAVQALYQMDIAGTTLPQTIAEYESLRLGKELDGETYREADPAYFRVIMAGVLKDQVAIDKSVHATLTQDWPLSRIDSILRAILRCGTYELNERKDVPARVIISEYVDVAKAFFEVQEPKMVNGVLDRIAKQTRSEEFS